MPEAGACWVVSAGGTSAKTGSPFSAVLTEKSTSTQTIRLTIINAKATSAETRILKLDFFERARTIIAAKAVVLTPASRSKENVML